MHAGLHFNDIAVKKEIIAKSYISAFSIPSFKLKYMWMDEKLRKCKRHEKFDKVVCEIIVLISWFNLNFTQ